MNPNMKKNRIAYKKLLTNPIVAAVRFLADDNWTENVVYNQNGTLSWIGNGVNEYTEFHDWSEEEIKQRYSVGLKPKLAAGTKLNNGMLPITISGDKEFEVKRFNDFSWFSREIDKDILGVYMYILDIDNNYKLTIVLPNTTSHGNNYWTEEVYAFDVQKEIVNSKYVINTQKYKYIDGEEEFFQNFKTELHPLVLQMEQDDYSEVRDNLYKRVVKSSILKDTL